MAARARARPPRVPRAPAFACGQEAERFLSAAAVEALGGEGGGGNRVRRLDESVEANFFNKVLFS